MNNLCWGVGLRAAHFENWCDIPQVPALEVMADNLIHHKGGPALWHTLEIVRRAPVVVLHGIGMNLGGADPLSRHYMEGIQRLIEILNPSVISDHLCFSKAAAKQSYELLPLIRNSKTLDHVAQRVDALQQFFGRQYSVENVSAYISYKDDTLSEGDFLNELAHRTGCGILLDVNNVFVSSKNFNLDPVAEIARFDPRFVSQIHVAGHSLRDDFLFDTHDESVCSEVWSMLRDFLSARINLGTSPTAQLPVILENDNPETALHVLLEELESGRLFCGGI